jgi:hypothetical protein
MKKELEGLSGEELRGHIAVLAEAEREVLVELLWSLAELDRRKGYAEVGCSSLMAYCTGELKMSVGSAYRRMTAARMMAKHPVIEDYLIDGRLNLSTVCALKHVIDKDEALLDWAVGKSEEELAREVAEMRGVSGPEVRKLQINADPEFMALLEDVKSALSHKIPDLSLEKIFAECMRTTLKQKRKTTNVPAMVAKAVWERAKGCCEFTAENGKRCGSRYQLECHHHIPDARQGPATVENIFLYCRVHNVHRAIVDFGPEHMSRYVGQARVPADHPDVG